MELNLSKPICFFDLETTGINIAKDRIIEISILKVYPGGNKDVKTWLVNPTIPIPEESILVHKITNGKVKNEPEFKEIAMDVYDMIKDSDMAGYNSNRFDVPLLAEELIRAGINFDFKNTKFIDVQTIFHKKEQRTLSAAYKFYCGKDLENAHSAYADTEASYEIIKSQLDVYSDLENNVSFLSSYSSQKQFADFAGFIIYNNQHEEIFSFGKYKGRKVEDVFKDDSGYYGWLLNADFPLYTKKIFTEIKLRQFGKH